MKVVKLKTKSDGVISDKIRELLEHSLKVPCVGMAFILIHADGSALISTKSTHNTRLQMLGAASDMVYTLAKGGDSD